MNLVFVSSEQYPNGGAATNRHMAYAKGLMEAGHMVTFIFLSKQNTIYDEFIEEGIKYIYEFPEKYNINNRNKLKNLFLQNKSINAGKHSILEIQKKRKIDAIILLDIIVWVLIPFIRLAKINGIKVMHERTEYPFVINNKGLIEKINLFIYLSFVLKKFDGIFVINHALKNYFNQLLNNKIPIEIINMIVDPSRFKVVSTDRITKFQYLAYCGSLNGDKDGVDILIKAFGSALIRGKINRDIRLMLIGNNSNEIFQKKLNSIIEEMNCKDNIIFTGKVERLIIPDLLNNATALALARPNNKQAEGGFPTKLGEYLATGKPVIITDVGEICQFLKDGHNAFIAKPGNVDSFSEKICEVFSNYQKALKIGTNGKILVYNEFNYFKQAGKLARFIDSI